MRKLAFPHDPETPDEFKSDDPIWCTVCEYEFDVDEDLGDTIKLHLGFYMCLDCIKIEEQEIEREKEQENKE